MNYLNPNHIDKLNTHGLLYYAIELISDFFKYKDENDYIAKIIIKVQRQINSKSENCNVISSDKEKSIKVFMITENGEKWCYIGNK